MAAVPRPRTRESLPCVRGGGGSFFDHIFYVEGDAGYNPPRRRGLRIAPNTASGISRSLRRSSSPKHNHYVGLRLGPRLG